MFLISQRGGKSGRGDTRRKFRNFQDYSWDTLLKTGSDNSNKFDPSKGRAIRLRRAEFLVRTGELSRAAIAITSKGLAADDEITIKSYNLSIPNQIRQLQSISPHKA